MKRRAVLLGGVAGALGLGAVLRPDDKGRNHQPYFREVSAALDHAGASGPTLVIDRSALEANIATLKS
ncbi:MAG: DSD1 family PLP-dependent enzyme, partial [Halieaceae bacterium]|nr:DSD1 family PLP-dependent enzyme [Halieaceae bacterium]